MERSRPGIGDSRQFRARIGRRLERHQPRGAAAASRRQTRAPRRATPPCDDAEAVAGIALVPGQRMGSPSTRRQVRTGVGERARSPRCAGSAPAPVDAVVGAIRPRSRPVSRRALPSDAGLGQVAEPRARGGARGRGQPAGHLPGRCVACSSPMTRSYRGRDRREQDVALSAGRARPGRTPCGKLLGDEAGVESAPARTARVAAAAAAWNASVARRTPSDDRRRSSASRLRLRYAAARVRLPRAIELGRSSGRSGCAISPPS